MAVERCGAEPSDRVVHWPEIGQSRGFLPAGLMGEAWTSMTSALDAEPLSDSGSGRPPASLRKQRQQGLKLLQ